MSTETVAFRMQLHPGRADEYRRRHDAIWPELKDALLAAGVLDYRIFLDPGSHALFAVLTKRTDDNLAHLRASELMSRWWAMMADIMETEADGSPVETSLAEMFALTA